MNAFERAAPLLQAALDAEDERPLWTLDDVRIELEQGRAHLWLGERSAMVTTIQDFNGERIIECWLAGGDMGEILSVTPIIEDHARSVGCTQAHITGRRGWVRALAPQGYEHYATVVRKLLV